jgi:CubicO group peptidase (beta-lactamase class C family)
MGVQSDVATNQKLFPAAGSSIATLARMRTLCRASIGVLAVLAAASAHAVTDADRARRVDAHFAELNRGSSPGLALAVVRDGKVVLRRGYGLANLEHRIPVTTATVFDTASLAKQFTGAAIAILVEEGKVKLEDDVRTYIPELAEFGEPITIEHLLRHTSGIRDWVGTLSVAGWRPDDAIVQRQILAMAYSQRALNFTPGTQELYSNTGYNLLAEIVQRVTGQPLAAFLAERIFKPLGMVRTHVRTDYTQVIPNRAFGYARAADGIYRHIPNNLAAPGSSSLFSTADDLALWLIDFQKATAVGRGPLTRMRRPGALKDGTPVRSGFGITASTYKGLPFFSSFGRWASFHAFDAYFPEQNFGVVVLANGQHGIEADAAVRFVTDVYLEGTFIEPPSSEPEPLVTAAKPAASDPPSSANLHEFAGDYDSEELGTSYRVSMEDGALQLVHRRRGTIPLQRLSPNEFTSADGYLASVVFRRDGEGRVTAFVVNGDPRSRDIVFTRRAP